MLDCGPGSVRQALTLGIDLRSLDSVVLSHLHEDHCLDVSSIAFLAMYGRWPRLPLFAGPPGTAEVAMRLTTMHRPNAHTPEREIEETADGDVRELGGFCLTSRETPHAAGMQAFSRRFQAEGRSLVFSGDTRANPELMCELAAGTDVLLHECFSRAALERYAGLRSPEAAQRIMERIPTTHSEVGDVARIAHDAGARRLVLTHILPTEDESHLLALASGFYKGDIVVARDGLVLDI
jgi:ribonuclease BN (tRNA processing enzyme)